MRRVLASAAAALLLAGCGASSTVGREEPEPPRETLTIATGGKGGIYAVYGAELAKKITKRASTATAAARSRPPARSRTSCACATGRREVALTLADTALDAVEGREAFDTPVALRALAQIYPSYVQLVTRPARASGRSRPRRQARQRRLARLRDRGRRGAHARRRGHRRSPRREQLGGRRVGAGARGREARRVLLVRRRADRADHEPVPAHAARAGRPRALDEREMRTRWGGVYERAPIPAGTYGLAAARPRR